MEDKNFDIVSTDNEYKNRSFKKKKRGIAGFFAKIGDGISNWWKNMKKWQKTLFCVFTSLVAIVLIVAIVFLSVFDYNYNEITVKPQELGFENVIDKKVVNIALFGIDTRSTESFKGNSDSIMVLSINTETKKVKIVSIMRDSLVPIQRDGRTTYRKINSAYATSPELAIKTINQNFGLDISEYATVNFFGMAEIIDAVGGIDVEFTRQEVSTQHIDGFNGLVKRHCETVGVNPEDYYIKEPGKHHVNGIQAVAYSRIRKFVNIWGTNNDFGRTDRQRYVMEQLFNKALTLEKSKYVSLVKALIPYTETSLSYSEIMGLAFDILLKSPTFEQTRMPLSEYQMRSPNVPSLGSVVYYDLDFAKNLLHAFFYEDISPEEYVKTNGITKNDWFSQVAGHLISNGEPDDDTNSDVTSSVESDISSNVSSSVESGDNSTPTTSEGDITSSEGNLSGDNTSSGESQPSTSSGENNSSSIPTDSSSQTPSTPTTPETPPTSSEQGTSSENSTTQVQRVKR